MIAVTAILRRSPSLSRVFEGIKLLMAAWTRSELSSVNGLMSLMGAMDMCPGTKDCGLEKRLELDLVASTHQGMLEVMDEQWNALFECLDECGSTTTRSEGLRIFKTSKAMVVVARTRVIITSSAEVMLHTIIDPLLRLCREHRCTVEWSSFMRKNRSSPWTDHETNQVMAAEFLALKRAFPRGASHLFGPLDGDHYFYFIFDGIDRRIPDAVLEDDVQVNVVMYGVKSDAVSLNGGTAKSGVLQECVILSDPMSIHADAYESTRRFESTSSVPIVTYETNASVHFDHESRIAQLVKQYAPERFTLMTLFDPHSVLAKRTLGATIGSDYTIENRATTEFAPGYVVCKTMFIIKGATAAR
jgi:S-adenosylmethionine decarboxylase